MSGTQNLLRMAELLCVRLCHDLSGPLGALIGVLDVAREEHPDSETLTLAEETAGELAQRLKLLRAAWGPEADDLDIGRLQEFAEGLSSSRRVQLDLNGLGTNRVFPPQAGRVLLNLLLMAADCLPGGGMVALSEAPSAGVLVTISGSRAAWPSGFGGWLVDPDSAVAAILADPRHLQPPLTALLVRAYGYRLSILMPASPLSGAERAPPMLLSLQP
jgi:histidine phosphotransferase ChpT